MVTGNKLLTYIKRGNAISDTYVITLETLNKRLCVYTRFNTER
jgi:hypothetical protein